jgi:ABC-type amino acid transport substrate-binding protein
VASSILPTVDPLASQMARLLLSSDADELREIIKRWLAEAPAGGSRRVYEEFGSRLLELKEALAGQPVQPTIDEMEIALTMMLRLAATEGPRR